MKHHRRNALARRSRKQVYLNGGSGTTAKLKYLGSQEFMVLMPYGATPLVVDYRRGARGPKECPPSWEPELVAFKKVYRDG